MDMMSAPVVQAIHNIAMEIGISLPHFRHLASTEAIRRIAQYAEAIGLDSIWVTDHILLTDAQTKRFGTVFYEPIATLSYAAAITHRVREIGRASCRERE